MVQADRVRKVDRVGMRLLTLGVGELNQQLLMLGVTLLVSGRALYSVNGDESAGTALDPWCGLQVPCLLDRGSSCSFSCE